jgi:hypothetical protein
MARALAATDLNPKQQHWLRLYTGRDPDVAGNATACYKRTYGTDNDRVAQAGASRLLNHPKIAPILQRIEAEAVASAGINAQFVLDQSLRLYDTAMGDLPVDREVRTIRADGTERVERRQTREYDPNTAHKALTMLGNNKHVQAFQQNIEISHTHYLEERLAARSKAIEGRAQVIDDSAPALADDSQRGSISAEVNSNSNAPAEKTSSEREGATGE